MLQDNSFGSSKTSPPMAPFSLDQLGTTVSRPTYSTHSYGLSQSSERQMSDRSLDSQPPPLTASNSDPLAFMAETRTTPTVMIRKLPRNTSNEAINAMLLFSEDLINTDIIRSPYPEDHGYTTAVARFKSPNGAMEAQAKLHGKSVTTKDARLIVEIQSSSSLERRATIDGTFLRQESGSTSSASSHGAPPPPRSRYGSTFQSADKISPPLPTPDGNGFGYSDTNRIQSLFSPTSPMSNGLSTNDRFRVSGKSVINNDNLDDDETGELLKDPLAYAKSGQQARRSSHAQPPVTQFNKMSLSTGTNGNHSNFAPPSASHSSTPRGSQALQPPHSPTNITNMSSSNGFNMNMPRNAYPPINPADQNPPCNTLYVGNLPADTSEDELKAIFSKQRGYKRMCFRTKHQGPMCFVEFEDISYATKALRDLYGHPLHNSVKGGVRLSYSKNPLGIRNPPNGQAANGMHPHPLSMGAHGYAANGNGANGASNFTAVSGPPPGINSPPGFNNASNGYSHPPQRDSPTAFDHTVFSDPFATSSRNAFNNVIDPFPLPRPNVQQNYTDAAGPRNLSGGLPPNISSGKFGRDSRGSMSNYMYGR